MKAAAFGLLLLGLLDPLLAAAQALPAAEQELPAAEQARIEDLLGRMTLPEKLGQLTLLSTAYGAQGPGDRADLDVHIEDGTVGGFFNAFGPELTRSLQNRALTRSRLGIPLFFGFDVIHGFRTIFPTPLALASSWDPELTREASRIAATEASAEGVNMTFAPMLDVTRDPRWGRIVEGPGEDPLLGAALARAAVAGFQGSSLAAPDSIAAVAKHIGGYGAVEGGRDYNTLEITDRTLREIYLPPFKAAVEAGVAAIMPSLSDLGGIPASANRPLLHDILRDDWGFRGVVLSDDMAIGNFLRHGIAADFRGAARLALDAGIDVDMQSQTFLRGLQPLPADPSGADPSGAEPSGTEIDDAVRRVLALKVRLGLFERPDRASPALSDDRVPPRPTAEHLAAAREAAQRSMVLLKNAGNLLPLPANPGTIAVIGPLADDSRDPLGSWPGAWNAPGAVTLLQGLRERLPPGARLLTARGSDFDTGDGSGVAAAVALAAEADLVILALGENRDMSGEAKSRAALDLPGAERALAEAVLETGKPVIAILFNGHPLTLPWLEERATGILEAWFPGSESGHAIADLLFGDAAPTARLPVTVPRSVGQIPIYYNHRPTGRPPRRYDPFTSQYIDEAVEPLYPFGFGLGYTTFSYGTPTIDKPVLGGTGSVAVAVEIMNTGARSGEELVQLYTRQPVASVARPVLELRGFSRLHLDPGETGTAHFTLHAADLAFVRADGRFAPEAGRIQAFTGPDSATLKGTEFTLAP